MSRLRGALERYIRMRQGLGYKYSSPARRLSDFVGFMEARSAKTITVALATEWVTQIGSQPTWAISLTDVRCFAQHVAHFDPLTEVPPADAVPTARRAKPYIYSDAEIEALLAAALALPPANALRRWTYHCVFGLIAVAAQRHSEVLNLCRDDVDLDQGVLTIRQSKFGKSRLVPLHATTVAVLRDYSARRDARFTPPRRPYFFVAEEGGRLLHQYVHRVFWRLSRQNRGCYSAGRPSLLSGGRFSPRPRRAQNRDASSRSVSRPPGPAFRLLVNILCQRHFIELSRRGYGEDRRVVHAAPPFLPVRRHNADCHALHAAGGIRHLRIPGRNGEPANDGIMSGGKHGGGAVRRPRAIGFEYAGKAGAFRMILAMADGITAAIGKGGDDFPGGQAGWAEPAGREGGAGTNCGEDRADECKPQSGLPGRQGWRRRVPRVAGQTVSPLVISLVDAGTRGFIPCPSERPPKKSRRARE